MSARYKATIKQGSTFERNITWKTPTGTIIPLDNLSARMQIRSRTPDGNLVIDLDSATKGGITLNTTTDVLTIKITAAQTASMPVDDYIYDLEVEDLSHNVYTLIYGEIKFIAEVTHA